MGARGEVDAALVGRRAELVVYPFDLTSVEVRLEGRSMGLAVPVRICRHTHPRARPDTVAAPAPTGIDYLSRSQPGGPQASIGQRQRGPRAATQPFSGSVARHDGNSGTLSTASVSR